MTVPTTIQAPSGPVGRVLTPVTPSEVAAAEAWRPLDIASDRCKGCELCITACPHHVLALDDRVVNRLGTAMEGDSASAVATALRDLASAMTDVADAIEKRPSREQQAGPAAQPPEQHAE